MGDSFIQYAHSRLVVVKSRPPVWQLHAELRRPRLSLRVVGSRGGLGMVQFDPIGDGPVGSGEAGAELVELVAEATESAALERVVRLTPRVDSPPPPADAAKQRLEAPPGGGLRWGRVPPASLLVPGAGSAGCTGQSATPAIARTRAGPTRTSSSPGTAFRRPNSSARPAPMYRAPIAVATGSMASRSSLS